ncbi:MAG: glycosyltransferase [bacterium]|jgi:hypothetical protein
MFKRIKIASHVAILKIRYSIWAIELFSLVLYLAAKMLIPFESVRATALLMRSHRNTRNLKRHMEIEALFEKHHLLTGKILSKLMPEHFRREVMLPGRIFKVKEPGENEKGALIVKFTAIFAMLRTHYDLAGLLRDYYLILEPSYSGYCTPEILGFLEFNKSDVIVQAAEKLDYAFLQRLKSNLVPIEMGSSNWVDDRVFCDLKLPKEYDCIMVALWGDIKRHYLLFEALRQMDDPGYRVCLVGRPWGRRLHEMEELAEFYGVRNNIDFFEKLKPHEVNVLLNKSKVNLLLTLKEGANKSIFEGFFANVPGLVLKENFGVNKSYLNGQTGRLVPEKKLTEALLWFRENYVQFSPRKWALENISPVISTIRLEAKLKEIAVKQGELWTRSLVVKVNRPECEYYYPEEALSPLDLSLYSKQ